MQSLFEKMWTKVPDVEVLHLSTCSLVTTIYCCSLEANTSLDYARYGAMDTSSRLAGKYVPVGLTLSRESGSGKLCFTIANSRSCLLPSSL